MLTELTPRDVIVYGSYNQKIFGKYEGYTRFHHLPDWTTYVHKRKKVVLIWVQVKVGVTQFCITESEDNYWIEDYWKSAIETAARNIDETLTFIQKDCDNEELYVLSEIFEEIAKRTQNRKVIQVLRECLAKVTLENYN